MKDNTLVAIYQGERGVNPDLDFIVKYKEPGKRLRAPSHTHWIVDLVIKGFQHKKQVADFANQWLEIYSQTEPFSTKQERDDYHIIHKDTMCTIFGNMNDTGSYTIEFLSTIIELFIRCEKQAPGAFMFKTLLELIRDFGNDKKDFYQVVGYSKRV